MYKIATLCLLYFFFGINTSAQTTNCELVAGFTINQTSTHTFHFLNTSIGLSATDSIKWTFGDGTSSSQVSPTHTYSSAGTYHVCIRIQKRNSAGGPTNCVRELCKIVQVAQLNCELVASFTSTQTGPNTFHFQNTSPGLSPTDSIRWTFGDGSTSNQLNPTHTYTHAGLYNVCVRIQKRNSLGTLSNCVKEFCRIVTVAHTNTCELLPAFTATLVGPNTFHFQNTSIGLAATDSIRWTFGDGTSSNQVSPSHTYAHAGQYNVCIRIQKKNPNGVLTNCVKELCKVVVVGSTSTCELVASFTATLTGPNTFHFQNTSIGLAATDSIRWTFGDGTSSNQINPHHTYAHTGQYNVCIRIQKRNNAGTLSNCVKEFCRVVVVGTPTNCELAATFTTTLIGPNSYYFQNTTIGLSPTDSVRWTFGDGTSSGQASPNHTYAQPGRYNVCVRIQRRNSAGTLSNCVREFCKIVEPNSTTSCALPYPNPATTNIHVQVPLVQNQMIHVYIYNANNVLVKQKHQQGYTGNNLMTLSIADLMPGVYTMKVIQENNVCITSFLKL